ncbi:MAG: hypothetical protein GC190_20535 [Alphaproteobacteria bacterium]|nr:hypothetical protein [Alphaproteobacteria bacterium]
MTTVELDHPSSATRASYLRWIALAAAVGAGAFFALRLSDTIHAPAAHEATKTQAAISPEHCAQFIAIAKAAYGSDWKYRLDPRDTTCAKQVREEWQYDWTARHPMTPMPSGTMRINEPSPTVDEAPTTIDSRIRSPETYCLNVISLARTKYGPNWATQLPPEEAANCGEAIRAASSH